jgi:hypothetical protein
LIVPDSVLLANTVVSIPKSWGWTLNTVGSEGIGWANASISVPDGGWCWASAFVVDDLSWGRAAITDVEIFIPDVAGVTGYTFQVDWIPVLWLIASNAEFSSNKISSGTTALSLIGSKAVIGEDLIVSL